MSHIALGTNHYSLYIPRAFKLAALSRPRPLILYLYNGTYGLFVDSRYVSCGLLHIILQIKQFLNPDSDSLMLHVLSLPAL